jgi:Putative Flp pilus-assembly TadE/G-like
MTSRVLHINMPKHPFVCPSARRPRRGSATLWMVLWLPCLLALFCVLVGVANLWLARIELENSLESAALAAVKAWGEAGGGDTLAPRNVGVAYAHANSVRRDAVAINTNYDFAGVGNRNEECAVGMAPPSGNLIFGAINDSNPDNVIFDAGMIPGCGLGTVLFDASGNGSGNLVADNGWGISFYNTPSTPAALRITQIVIDLRANGGAGSFTGSADITDNLPQPAVRDNNGNSQPDLVGFTDPPAQIAFSYPSAGRLQIDFLPDLDPNGGTDDGFAPGDRFRFGQDVIDVSSGNSTNDGDGIGSDGASVTVFFSLGGVPLPPLSGVVGTFVDHTDTNNPPMTAIVSPITNTLIVNPALVPDLPPPPANAANNNGQSYVLLSSLGNGKFGVRAQASVPVQPLGFKPFLGNITQYCIQAKATAVYDCATQRVKLIRIDKFICP